MRLDEYTRVMSATYTMMAFGEALTARPAILRGTVWSTSRDYFSHFHRSKLATLQEVG
ncbi:hypothetical protein T484DRAFT_1794619 [Baffinella frigidus]|nr:hypothetical protein T484DRAFT_1794619 [Cryptophyta sp. CCMP2293]